jgi:hypothetical protein
MKNEYHGFSHLVPMWALKLWKKFMCPKGYHAFDEVLGMGYHCLSCDACGISVYFYRAETQEESCQRVEREFRRDMWGEPMDIELDAIAAYIDDCMRRSEWHIIDAIFKSIEVEGTSIDLLLTYLTMTWVAKEHLKEYEHFIRRVRIHLDNMSENSEELLKGL